MYAIKSTLNVDFTNRKYSHLTRNNKRSVMTFPTKVAAQAFADTLAASVPRITFVGERSYEIVLAPD